MSDPVTRTNQGARPIGGRDPKRPGRDFKISTNDFTMAYQSEPLPLCYGAAWRAGTYIVPVWKLRAKKIKTTVGK